MKRVLRKIAAVAVTAAMVLGCTLVSGCSEQSDKSIYEQVKERGKLIVGMNAEFAPFEFHINDNGEDKVVGLDIPLAEEIAKDLGVELEIREMEFDPLIQNLKAGQVDILISALVPSAERKAEVDFSKIYFHDSNVALINATKAEEFKALDDLMGKRVCFQLGSYQEGVTKQVFGEDNLTILDSTNTILLTLKADQIDAFITSKTVAEQAMAADPSSYAYIGDDRLVTEEDGCAVAVPKGEDEILEHINATIDRVLENGDMDKFVKEACEQAAANVQS